MQQKTIQILSIALFATLLVWGGHSLLTYVGVPVHGAVLFSDGVQDDIDATCGGPAELEACGSSGGLCAQKILLCRGMQGFPSFIGHTLTRLSPLLSYAILSVVGLLILLGWQWLKNGRGGIRMEMRPWHLIALFVGSLWLLFTVQSFGGESGSLPMRYVVEPSPQVYQSTDEQALRALQNNVADLKDQNCLLEIGTFQPGVPLYQLSGVCIQKAFFGRVLSQVLFIGLLLFEFLALGGALLSLLRIRPRTFLGESVLSLVLGACGWIVLLWTLAVLGIFTANAGWVLMLAVPVACYRSSLAWLRRLRDHQWSVECTWYDVRILLGWLLVSYLALNFLTVVRPFPIGWDDLGSYLNRPRLLVSYGEFIFSMSPFQWEYITSLGFLLFGYDSIFGATASMLINWMAGLLAVLTVIFFGQRFIGPRNGLLAAVLYYVLPLVGHFSFADMKIDNAVFTTGALGMLCAFEAIFGSDDEEPDATQSRPVRWSWWILSGVLLGFSFAMKPTAIMVILAVLLIVLGMAHWAAALGVIFLGVLAFLFQGTLDVTGIATRIAGAVSDPGSLRTAVIVVSLVGMIAGFGYAAIRRRGAVASALRPVGVFVAAIAVTVIPWILHNNIQRGQLVPRLELSAVNNLTPTINYKNDPNVRDYGQPIKTLPPELAINPEDPACKPTGSTEELDRYWGFSGGWGHYLTLPWRTVMNVDSAGYYVTTIPALLLVVLVLLVPFVWTRRGRWLRWLLIASGFMLLQWVFLANGVPWYGLSIFLGLVIGLEALVAYAPDAPNRAAAWFFIGCSILIALNMRMWQFDQQNNLIEYPIGKISAEALRLRTVPHYDNIRQVVMQRYEQLPERPYLYRVGTFIPYFIPQNLQVIGITDHQLDVFNCLYQERNPELTVRRLQALGFNSIIFDTNTATIERDQEGSLHKKVNAFVDFLNNPASRMQLLVNDPSAGVAYVLLP